LLAFLVAQTLLSVSGRRTRRAESSRVGLPTRDTDKNVGATETKTKRKKHPASDTDFFYARISHSHRKARRCL